MLLLLGNLWMVSAQQPARPDLTSSKKERATPLKVGDAAPDFTLEDLQGQKVRLSDTNGKMPTVIFFYRGWW